MIFTFPTRDTGHLHRDMILITSVVACVSILSKTLDCLLFSPAHSDSTLAKTLVHEADRYYNMSIQDGNPQVRYQHAVHALAFLEAGRRMMADADLERIVKFNMHELHHAVTRHEKACQKELVRQCPKLKIAPYRVKVHKSIVHPDRRARDMTFPMPL